MGGPTYRKAVCRVRVVGGAQLRRDWPEGAGDQPCDRHGVGNVCDRQGNRVVIRSAGAWGRHCGRHRGACARRGRRRCFCVCQQQGADLQRRHAYDKRSALVHHRADGHRDRGGRDLQRHLRHHRDANGHHVHLRTDIRQRHQRSRKPGGNSTLDLGVHARCGRCVVSLVRHGDYAGLRPD